MTVDGLRARIEAYKASLTDKNGQPVVFGDTAPADMKLIEDICTVLGEMEYRLGRLETVLG